MAMTKAESGKKYRESHKKEIAERNKEYRKTHREHLNKVSNDWNKSHYDGDSHTDYMIRKYGDKILEV